MRYIFLVGIMGSGKTFWGRRMAEHLGVRFVDTDDLVVARTGSSIPAIFAREGEFYFRQLESDVLRDDLPAEDCVIATGGGMPCFGDNMDQLLRSGVVVWLDPDPAIIARRIWKTREKRPLIADAGSEEEVAQRIGQLLEKRAPFYAKADIVEKQDLPEMDALIQRIASVGKFASG